MPPTMSAAAALSSTMSRKGPGSPAEHVADGGGVRLRVAALEIARASPRGRPASSGVTSNTEIAPVLELGDARGARRRQLVETVVAVHDPGVLGAEVAAARPPVGSTQRPVEHADHLALHAGRVRQRPQQIEDGADAELGAHRRPVLHRRVVHRRPHEADTGLGDGARDGDGRHVELDAERGQHVGGTRQRGDASGCRAWRSGTPAPAATSAAQVETL